MEERYKVKLLERSNKFVRLTKPGEIFYYHAKERLARYSMLERLIDDFHSSAQGPLSIGAGYTFGEYMLPKIISAFNSIHPNIIPKITIKNSHRIANQVRRRDLDCGIIEGEVDKANLITESIAQDEMLIAVPAKHHLANKQIVEVGDLVSETWIIREEGSGTREITDRMFSKINLIPKHTMEFGSTQLIKEAVETGLGISFLSDWVARKEVTFGSLRMLRIKGFSIKRSFYCITNDSQYRTKAADLFIDFLRNYPYEKKG